MEAKAILETNGRENVKIIMVGKLHSYEKKVFWCIYNQIYAKNSIKNDLIGDYLGVINKNTASSYPSLIKHSFPNEGLQNEFSIQED